VQHLQAAPAPREVAFVVPDAVSPHRSSTTPTLREVEGVQPQPQPVRNHTPQQPLPPPPADRPPRGAAQLHLSTYQGEPGQRLSVSGSGYAANQRVDLYWDGINVTGRRMIRTNASGSFHSGFTIPQPTTNGSHTIMALEAAPGDATLATNSEQKAQRRVNFTVTGGAPHGTTLESLEVPQPLPVPQQARATTQQVPLAPKAWTFAVYIAGDNSLSTFADVNLLQMTATAGTSDQVNIVSLVDQEGLETRYLEINSLTTTDVTPDDIRGQNIDTGDPQNFVDFMAFVEQFYPAQRYAIVVWDHGGGWIALQQDDRSGNYWDMGELRSALQDGLQNLGRQQYDVLIFDSCLMAQYEVALQIEDLVDVMIASAENVPGTGMPYDTFLAALLANPTMTADQFANAVVEGYAAFYRDYDLYTISAIKLEEPFTTLQTRVDAFARALLEAGPWAAGSLREARDTSLHYDFTDFVDLGSFARQVQQRVPDGEVQDTATALLATLTSSNLVLSEAHSQMAADSTGLSMYLPSPVGDIARGQYHPGYDSLLVEDTAWHTFVKAFYTGIYPETPPEPEPEPDDSSPPLQPPPAVASSLSDIVYTNQSTPTTFDLYRIQAVPDPTLSADTIPLLSDGYRNSFPRWSPDGSYVTYVSDRNSNPITDIDTNLFLIESSGSGEPVQLTFSTVSCDNGYGTGIPCIVEYISDPAWLSDNSGILYTLTTIDMSSTNPDAWTTAKSIRQVNLTRPSSDPAFDIQLLPNTSFTSNNVPVGEDVRFDNADYNSQEKVLVFHYRVGDECWDRYNVDLCNNDIGIVDFTSDPPAFNILVLNQERDVRAGNYLYANFPAWHNATSGMAFLYSRVGNPPLLDELDPRDPPAPNVRENPTRTYDIGYLTVDIDENGAEEPHISATMHAPLWAFKHPDEGEGAYYRPDWKPDGSGDLTASYSRNGGYTYDVGLFISQEGERRGFRVTNDGYSTLPSWGTVNVQDIPARLETNVKLLSPGLAGQANFVISSSGFEPGEQVQVYAGYNQSLLTQVMATATADEQGEAQVNQTLTKGMPPGVLYFQAFGASSRKWSNVDYVALYPRLQSNETRVTPAAGGNALFNDGTLVMFGPGTLPVTSTVAYQSGYQSLAGHTFKQGDPFRFFSVEVSRENGSSSGGEAQPTAPVTMTVAYTSDDLTFLPQVDAPAMTLFGYNGTTPEHPDGWQPIQPFGSRQSITLPVDLRDYTEFVLADTSPDMGAVVYLPLVWK
jgi:hypothetical protein